MLTVATNKGSGKVKRSACRAVAPWTSGAADDESGGLPSQDGTGMTKTTTTEDEQPQPTAYELFMKAIAGNPRFQPAKKSDKGFVIVGAKEQR